MYSNILFSILKTQGMPNSRDLTFERVGPDQMGGRLRVLLSGSVIDVRIQASFTFQRLDTTVA